MAQDTLAARVRAKYPGAYDDLDDATLERQVRAKFPGVYDDIPSTAATPPPSAPLPFGVEGLRPGLDLATGIAKGVGNTVIGLGEAAYSYIPGVSAVSDAAQRAIFGDILPGAQTFPAARQAVQPTTPLQQVGYTGEQIGEFFLPLGQAGRAAKVGEVCGPVASRSRRAAARRRRASRPV